MPLLPFAANDENSKNIETPGSDQWNLLANAMPQLVWIAEPDGVVTYYNDRVYEYSGARKNNNVWEWDLLLHPEDRHVTEQAWIHSVRTGSVYEIEHRVHMADGSYRWHLSRGYPQVDAEGRIIKWFGTATDIHNQMLFTEELNRKVEERTGELSNLNEQLRLYNKELEDLAFVAAHDLQEPLRKIRLFCSMLMQRTGNKLEETEKGYLNKVLESSNKMTTYLHTLLQYSALNQKEVIASVDLTEVVKNVLSEQEHLIRQKNAVINLAPLPVINAVPHQMHELFYHLINNALKFSQENVRPLIKIETRSLDNHDLPEGFSKDRQYIEIVVRDNGVGFEPDSAEKIFTMFQRVHDRTKYAGTGAGLALSKKVVHGHGGKIWAEGKVNGGATFKIILPVEY